MTAASRPLTDEEIDALSQDDAIEILRKSVGEACQLFQRLEKRGKWMGNPRVSITEITDVVETEILNYWDEVVDGE